MKICYKKEIYECNLKDSFYILYKEIILILKRFKRLCKRFIDVFKKDILVSLVLIMGYVILVKIVDKLSFIDSLWQTKEEVFTVFVVVAMQAFITSERKWRKDIRECHNIYVDFMFKISSLLDKLSKSANIQIEYNVLYSRDWLNLQERLIDEFNIDDISINRMMMIKTCKKIKDVLKDFSSKICCYDFFYNDNTKYSIAWSEDCIDRLIENINSTHNEYNIKNDLKLVYCSCYSIISDIRFLWRQDINIDREIINKLYKYNSEKLNDDFYMSKLIYRYEEVY